MDSDQGKLFIGGISWETNEEKLHDHFGHYGDVLQAVVMRDKVTQRPRGFGFVVFEDPAVIDTVIQDTHVIDGRTVVAKRALVPREKQQTSSRPGSETRRGEKAMDSDQGKLFIGGISSQTNEEKLQDHFGHYGDVLQAVVMRDEVTQRPRGFGFVFFADPAVIDTVLQDTHVIDGKTVEAMRPLLPREEQQTSSRPRSGYYYNTARSFGGGENLSREAQLRSFQNLFWSRHDEAETRADRQFRHLRNTLSKLGAQQDVLTQWMAQIGEKLGITLDPPPTNRQYASSDFSDLQDEES